MAPDDIRFSSLKEDRGWYFVEYSPPITNNRFSILQLSVVESINDQAVAEALEFEVRGWMDRYPIPVLATAFSVDGSVISLTGVRPIAHLMGWHPSVGSQPILMWELIDNDRLPDSVLDREFVKRTFANIPRKTGSEIQKEVMQHIATMKFGWWLVFVWAVFVPLVVAMVEWWSDLLGLVVLSYAFVKAVIQALRLMGRLPKSNRQRVTEASELRMRHHHYHCERNPEAFERLKNENFSTEATARTKAEALLLKAKARHSQKIL